MLNQTEVEIIKTYVIKNKQDRLLYELSNPQKRTDVIWRFAGIDIFKKECLKEVDYMSCKELKQCLFRLSGANEVYYIGLNYLGILSMEEAVKNANTGDICIIYCGNGIGYYQGEQECVKPPRYLLLKNN